MYDTYFEGVKDAMLNLTKLMDNHKIVDSALKSFEVLHCNSDVQFEKLSISEKTRSCVTPLDVRASCNFAKILWKT